MKCKKCNAEWNVSATVSASLTECPFCKESLIEPKDKLVFDNLHDALAAIYADEKYGFDVLLSDKCHLYITDYYPGIKTLMKARVKLVSTSGAAGFLKAAANSSKAEKERAILLAIQKLTDEGDGKDTATDIIYEYVSVLNWGVNKPQSATQTKQSHATGSTSPQPASNTVQTGNNDLVHALALKNMKPGDATIIDLPVISGKNLGFKTEYVDAIRFDRGYISEYFVTDTEHMIVEISDPYILIYDKKISAADEIVPLLEKIVQIGKRDLVIIAEDVVDEALACLALNKLRSVLNLVAVKAPGFGKHRKEMLQDIAILTNASIISKETGRKLKNARVEDLGRAEKVIIDKDHTIIIGGKGDSAAIKGRIDQIRAEILNLLNSFAFGKT